MSSPSPAEAVDIKKSEDSSSEQQESTENSDSIEKKESTSGDHKRSDEKSVESNRAPKRSYEDDDDDAEAKTAKISRRTDTSASGSPSDLSTGSTRDVVEGENNVADNTTVVADHYNAIEEKGLTARAQSRIVYLRNFNNWMKSMLIGDFINKVRHGSSHGTPLRVLDMCCGKGGDLLKWQKANITHLICADIAETSVKQCESRYKDTRNNRRNERCFAPIFTAEFITADCTKVRLREKYKDPSIHLDLVSCQFSLHYSFESLPQAECMMQNASESLRPGGYLIATIPDSNALVDQWKKCNGNKIGNDVFSVEFLCDKENIPLFGAKYHFQLEGVVNCPEFLVLLPLLKKLAFKYGLDFVMFERFEDFYERMKDEGRSLLGKMQALETYPPYHEAPLLGQSSTDYEHAIQYMQSSTGHRKIGTLSLSEWEATTIYSVVAFQKMKTTWNAEGKPEYSKL